MSPPRRTRDAVEPWYQAAKLLLLPPLKLWFAWHFEDLDNIPSDGPAIVACNHISYLDPLGNAYAVMRAGRRPRFLAKDELFEIPLVASALRGAGQIPVARGTGDRTPLLDAVNALRRGEVVVIYPEGTVTTNPDFSPMEGKTGVVRLALDAGAPIVPMASWGSQAVWQKSGRGSLKFGRPVWVKAAEPLDLSARAGERQDRESLRAMTGEVMAAISVLVEDLRSRYPKRWAPYAGVG
jgi:1-acyl-sn-glycerol-3-phosphate acyltransferase